VKGDKLTMQTSSRAASGPVDSSLSPNSVLRTVPYSAVRIKNGFWADRQITNRQVSLKHGYEMLEKAGNFHNLRMAAGWETGNYCGLNFYDEDVYKWLEALAWELGNRPDEDLQRMADEVIDLIAAVQQSDGYLNSYYQVVEPHRKWANLDFGHELYCAGHLFQAAIAFQRAVGDERLMNVARRLSDHINSVFGPGRREGTCGHPEIEMALVELYRATGEPEYLHLAQFFIDQRGKRKMKGMGSLGPEYHQDHVPVRQATEAAGHAVRQMYLNSAIADLYIETGEQALWDATNRLWFDIAGSKLFITGGVGSRYDGESFGESYELPPDQCYCETCAAIGSLMWNWRLLLNTGESRYADLIERTLYNGILSSPALDGRHFFYVNPLMLRNQHSLRQSTNPPDESSVIGRPGWHKVACCPPNVMRLFSSLAHYLATADSDGIQIHQYASADIDLAFAPDRRAALSMETRYPWEGRVVIKINESDENHWQLRLRMPGWCQAATISVNGEALVAPETELGYVVLDRTWQAGDIVQLELAMTPELIQPNPRVDAIRGCLAIQRGPLVYCLEAHDQLDQVDLLDAAIDPGGPLQSVWRSDLLGGLMTVEANGYVVNSKSWANELYRPLSQSNDVEMNQVKLVALPYFVWGNRGLASMRVWIPKAERTG
jgi:DUF1680 family protein